MKRNGPESDSYQAAVESSLTRPGLSRDAVPEALRSDFDEIHLPISGVSYEFSSAVAGLKARGGTLSEAFGLLGKSDQELVDLNSAGSHQSPSDPETQK